MFMPRVLVCWVGSLCIAFGILSVIQDVFEAIGPVVGQNGSRQFKCAVFDLTSPVSLVFLETLASNPPGKQRLCQDTA